MKRFLLYARIWTPGTLAVVGFLIALATSRKVADGLLTYMESTPRARRYLTG